MACRIVARSSTASAVSLFQSVGSSSGSLTLMKRLISARLPSYCPAEIRSRMAWVLSEYVAHEPSSMTAPSKATVPARRTRIRPRSMALPSDGLAALGRKLEFDEAGLDLDDLEEQRILHATNVVEPLFVRGQL